MKSKNFWKVSRIIIAIVIISAAAISFAGLNEVIAGVMHFQFSPSLIKTVLHLSAGAVFSLIIITLLTVLLGRIYCSFLCPLGILQDVIGFISRRRNKPEKDNKVLRYIIAGIAFGLFLFGWNLGFLLLDPYSNFGRIFSTFSIGSVIPFVIFTALVLWKKRIFCTSICPAGTLLGLISRFSLYSMRINDNCVSCGKCVSACPSGCIDLESKSIDNERCIRCMNCLSSCNVGGIDYSRRKPDSNVNAEHSESRREFLKLGGIALIAVTCGSVLARTGASALARVAAAFKILPPGARNAEWFTSKCTSCQLCTNNCPSGIIVPSPNGYGPVSLNLNNGFCDPECNTCSTVCPTGAITPLTLEQKKKTKIAEAQFNARNCIVFQENKACGECSWVCPTGAISLRKNGAPKLDKSICIGCGACQYICPANPKAMTITDITEQSTINI